MFWFGYHALGVAALLALSNSQMLGPADFRLKRVEPCPDGGPYQYEVRIEQRRVNRTNEVFNINMTFDKWIDEEIGVYLSVAQLLDGGYKKTYEMREDNLCEFAMKHIPKQFTAILRMAGVEEKCPIPPGSYSVQKYLVNYEDLPPMLYGDFLSEAQAVKDGKPLACIRLHAVTKPKDPIGHLG